MGKLVLLHVCEQGEHNEPLQSTDWDTFLVLLFSSWEKGETASLNTCHELLRGDLKRIHINSNLCYLGP